MLIPLERVRKIKPNKKEYVFKLFSFEEQKDFSSNEILEGQSIVFISERYETEDKFRHHILFAACTNNLVKVGNACDWTVLSDKKANCLGVLLIDGDMNEEEVIAELLESNTFSNIEKIPVINSEELHFLQGNENYFEKVTEVNRKQVVKDKIKEFFNMKNVNFLFGSGTSSPAIPIDAAASTAA